MEKPKTITETLVLTKDTKRTYVYTNEGATAVSQLYVAKAALGGTPPQAITLTIEETPQ